LPLFIPAASKKKILSSGRAVCHHHASISSTSELLIWIEEVRHGYQRAKICVSWAAVAEEQTDLTILLGAACLALAAIFALCSLAVPAEPDDPDRSLIIASSFG
jgi:hypothetical protein